MAKIMVVDDSSGIRYQVSQFLENNGFVVLTAENGQDGLDKLQANPDISLIISDINMPHMDGLTMVEKMRSDLGNQDVKVVMLTTERRSDLKKRAKAAGVIGWIIKPFNGPDSLELIKHLTS